MAFSRKKYKNTVHKNPFREDRPKSKKPIIITAISVVCLVALIAGIACLVNYCSLVRLSKNDDGTLYDRFSGTTYTFVGFNYTASFDEGKDYAYAECGGEYYYQIKYGISPNYGYVDTDKAIVKRDDFSQSVYIYATDGLTLPDYTTIVPDKAIIMAVGLIESDVGMVTAENMTKAIAFFKDDANVIDDAARAYLNANMDADTVRSLYISDKNCPGIYYILRYAQDKGGAKYIYTNDRTRYVKLDESFKDIDFLGRSY